MDEQEPGTNVPNIIIRPMSDASVVVKMDNITALIREPSVEARMVYAAYLCRSTRECRARKILAQHDVTDGIEQANETIRRWRAGQLAEGPV